MNTLVTGASGFVGRHLCRALEARGDAVTALSSRSCDLRDPQALDRLNGVRFDCIFHLAAWTQAGDFCLHHPAEQWLFNQAINTTVLRWWCGVQPAAKLITIGTSCSYDPRCPLVEDNYLAGTPIEGLYTYAMTKRMLHIGQMAAALQYNLRYLTVVPSTLYGADYDHVARQPHFIFDLIGKIVRGRLLDSPVVLWGDGCQKRELVHVADFTRALLRLTELVDNEVVNVGAGQEFEIREFAALIARHVGYDAARIQYDESKYVGARSKCLSTAKLQTILPDLDMRPLTAGLPPVIDWFSERLQASAEFNAAAETV